VGALLALAWTPLAASVGPAGPPAAPASIAPSAQDRAPPRFHGEYGLWVVERGDSTVVQWLTRARAPGFLKVSSGERVRHEATTPDSFAHRSAFRTPGEGALVLEYGAAGDPADRHRTVVHAGIPERAPARISAVDSLFVVGDVHGEFDRLVTLLANARLVGPDLAWTGGRKHLVFLGDLTDRGADVVRTLWLVYRLEREAARAGGGVHVVLGNHEIMVMLDDLRYVAPKEMEVARRHGVGYDRMFDPRSSVLGRWLVSKPALLRVGRVLLAHGGASPHLLPAGLEALDDSLARFTSEDLFYLWADSTYRAPLDSAGLARRDDFFWGEEGVFWYRGWVQSDTLAEQLAAVLDHFDADLQVVGHTPLEGMAVRYDGRLIATNTVPFANEMLLLVREGDGYRRWRYPLRGPPEPLP
jgi:hypothetical protein